jgi:hypothetical protein
VAEGVLAGDLPARAPELAKLVCLRAEFPIFASELAVDPRITGLVQVFGDDGDDAEIPDGTPSDLVVRARRYAQGDLPVGELLVDD